MNTKKVKGQDKYYHNFLDVIYENMQCGCCQFTPEESPRLIVGNERAFEIIGYKKDQFEQEKHGSMIEIVYEYDRDRLQQYIYELLLFNQKRTFEVRIVKRDGQIRWTSCNMVMVDNPEDGEQVLLMTFTDITENIEYQKQRDHIAETIGSGLAKICFSNEKLEVLYANRSFYDMWPKQQIMNGTFIEKERYEQYIKRPLFESNASWPTQIQFEYPCRDSNNQKIWVDARGVYTTRNQDKPIYVFVFNDITKLKSIETEQVNILKHIPGGVAKFMIDEQFTCVQANEYFYEYFHTNEFELSDGGMKFIYKGDCERIRRIVDNKSANKDDMEFICRIPTRDGIKWFMLYGTYAETKGDKLIYQFLLIECTKQEELRYALEKEKERYQIALQNMSSIVFEYDGAQDSFLYFWPTNDGEYGKTEKIVIFNYSNKVKSGQMVHPQDVEHIYEICKKCMDKHIQSLQIRVKKDKKADCEEYVWYEVQATVIRGEQGIIKIIGVMKNISREKEQEIEQEEGNEFDKLTKLYSRATVNRMADKYLAYEEKKNSALLMITIENFMLVNDRYGHMFGDAVLAEIAENIRKLFVSDNIVGRLGGIEFGVFSKTLSRDRIIQLSEKLGNLIRNIYVGEDARIAITCKIGIAFTRDEDTFSTLLERARRVVFKLKYEEDKTYGFDDETELDIEKLDKSDEFFDFNSDDMFESAEAEDIITFAFDVLERTKDVKGAISILLRRIGMQYSIERVSILEVNERDMVLLCKYQWAKSVNLLTKGQMADFEEEELERLKLGFDREGIIEAKPEEYPPFSRISEESIYAQTVLLCAVYEEGRYNGHLLFEQFNGLHTLTESQKSELKEIAKIISSYLAKIRADDASRSKGEFLSRMSHEIRTPMNAICGMTDLLLQNNLSGLNKEYVQTIKKASDNLVGIVNDILDFSKIEAGKLEIIEDEYEIRKMVDELVIMVTNKLSGKKISFYTRINPNIPKVLYGDESRIRQIVLNLLTNAAKYTEAGFVKLSIDYENLKNENEIQLTISVKDSGIGIRKEDVDKLFAEFQQVDTRRNRKVEGTGLGLAICRQLAELMEGKITIESEYGKGSIFKLTLKQKIYSNEPSVEITYPSNINMLVYEKDIYYARGLERVFNDLQVKVHFEEDKETFLKEARSGNYTHVLFDYDKLFYDVQKMIEKQENVCFISMLNLNGYRPREIDNKNHRFIHKPLTIFSMDDLLNLKDESENKDRKMQQFIAPEAKILVIDDNQVNLKVAEGLLKSYQCQIDTALSGFEAISKIMEKPEYDILFIDHMMPKMDGVETLQLIRKNAGEYGKNVVAIALTANALREARDMFAANSFQDFLAKPIVLKLLHQIMNQWIPENKKQMFYNRVEPVSNKRTIPDSIMQKVLMNGIDSEVGMQCCGYRLEGYLKMLTVVAETGKINSGLLKQYGETRDYEKYGLQVNALKGMAENIGAMKQLKMAVEHETALQESRYDFIDKEYRKLFHAYLYLINQINKVLNKEENNILPAGRMKKDKILVVDDSSNNLTMIEQTLKNDYEVLSVTSGVYALNVLKYYNPDLMLLDVEMPVMSGIQTLRKIRENEKLAKIPVIFLNAIKDSSVVAEGFQLGIADYIRKPFNQEEILKRIHRILTI